MLSAFFSVFLVVSLFFFFIMIFQLSGSMFVEDEVDAPFECGFNPLVYLSMSSYFMPFFLISFLYVLFDVELVIICFYPILSMYYYSLGVFLLLVFLVILITIYEWYKGFIDWV